MFFSLLLFFFLNKLFSRFFFFFCSFLPIFQFFPFCYFVSKNASFLGRRLKSVAIISLIKKRVLLVSSIFYSGVDFMILVVMMSIVKAMVSNKLQFRPPQKGGVIHSTTFQFGG
jgi:hypothetical protein